MPAVDENHILGYRAHMNATKGEKAPHENGKERWESKELHYSRNDIRAIPKWGDDPNLQVLVEERIAAYKAEGWILVKHDEGPRPFGGRPQIGMVVFKRKKEDGE